MAALGRAVVDHAPGCFASREINTAHVDVEGLVKAIDRDIERGPLPADAGAIDQDVEGAELILGAVERGADSGGVGHIERDGDGPPTFGLDSRDTFLKAVDASPHQRHGGTLVRQQPCEPTAEP